MREEIEGIIMDVAAIKERMVTSPYPSKLEKESKRLTRRLKKLFALQKQYMVLEAERQLLAEPRAFEMADQPYQEPVDPLDREPV